MESLNLAVDAGGTKLEAVLFDDDLHFIASARVGGVNINASTKEDCLTNIRECVQALAGQHQLKSIRHVYYTFIGPFEFFRQELEKNTEVTRYVSINEGQAGVLAGMLREQGLVAMAGTGSDVYYIHDRIEPAVGGWGPVISDRGSGAWMGRQAIERIEGMMEGWEEESSLLACVLRNLNASSKEEVIHAVYHTPAPYRRLACLLPAIAEAAKLGDTWAQELFERAGSEMARQTLCMVRRHGLEQTPMEIVCCGGAWKADSRMHARFVRELGDCCPKLTVMKPAFDQVLAGVVLHGLRGGRKREAIYGQLSSEFEQYEVKWTT